MYGTSTFNADNQNVEKSFRVEMKTENKLLSFFEKKYRAKDLEDIIFS